MNKHIARSFAALVLFSSTPALAWTWEDEPDFREWRTATLNWAQDIAATQLQQDYSYQELMELYEPPPREVWCLENPQPTTDDCQEKAFRVRLWLRDFLELDPFQPLPPGLPPMPPECQSICK